MTVKTPRWLQPVTPIVYSARCTPPTPGPMASGWTTSREGTYPVTARQVYVVPEGSVRCLDSNELRCGSRHRQSAPLSRALRLPPPYESRWNSCRDGPPESASGLQLPSLELFPSRSHVAELVDRHPCW